MDGAYDAVAKKSSPNPSSSMFSPLLSLRRLRGLQVYDDLLANFVKSIRSVSRPIFCSACPVVWLPSVKKTLHSTPLSRLSSWVSDQLTISVHDFLARSLFHPADPCVWSLWSTPGCLDDRSSRVSHLDSVLQRCCSLQCGVGCSGVLPLPVNFRMSWSTSRK